jgi:hypothetical protein
MLRSDTQGYAAEHALGTAVFTSTLSALERPRNRRDDMGLLLFSHLWQRWHPKASRQPTCYRAALSDCKALCSWMADHNRRNELPARTHAVRHMPRMAVDNGSVAFNVLLHPRSFPCRLPFRLMSYSLPFGCPGSSIRVCSWVYPAKYL